MIYTADHRPAHVHIWKSGAEVVINLGDEHTAPIVIENNGMGRKDERKALAIAAENQDFLLDEWRRIHGHA